MLPPNVDRVSAATHASAWLTGTVSGKVSAASIELGHFPSPLRPMFP